MMDKKYCVSTHYQGALHEEYQVRNTLLREYQLRSTLLSWCIR